jgi:hypothetical protein
MRLQASRVLEKPNFTQYSTIRKKIETGEFWAHQTFQVCVVRKRLYIIAIGRWAHPRLRRGRAIRLYLLPPPASKGYRFYPLRGRTPTEFAWGVCAARKLLGIFGWSLGLRPKLRKPKRCAFWFPLRCSKTASVPFLSCKYFAMQNTYETITAGRRGAHARLKPGCIYRTYQTFPPRRAYAACF